MRKKLLTAVFGLAVVLSAASPAWAGRRSFTVDPYSTAIFGNAGHNLESGNDGGLELLDGGSASFGFGFRIPGNYKNNSPIRVIFRWHAFSTSCDLLIRPDVLVTARVGEVTPNINAPDGLNASDGTDLWSTGATPDVTFEKVYLLTPISPFGMRPGDDILVGFKRDSADPSDTCAGEMFITGITVSYRTR